MKAAVFLSFAAVLGAGAAPCAARLTLQNPGPEARIRVVATLPALADLVRHVGGPRVTVRALARPVEDPHRIAPTPSLMGSVRKADLFVEVGLSLELWAENVLDGARNPKVRRGAPGHVFAAEGLPILEKPARVSRALGDLHPEGNPHLWLDPAYWPRMAANIARGLERVDPAGKPVYEARLQAFRKEVMVRLCGEDLVRLLGPSVLERLALGHKLWSFLERKTYKGEPLLARAGGWLARARPLRGKRVIFYHPSWVYLRRRFGLLLAAHVEDKPGVSPSAAHRAELLALVERRGADVIAMQAFYDDAIPRFLAEKGHLPLIVLPTEPGEEAGIPDLYALTDRILDRLLGALSGEAKPDGK